MASFCIGLIAIFCTALMSNGEKCSISNEDENAVATLSTKNLNFALNLYKSLANEENVFLSPFSITVALAMTAAGADGGTLDEMNNVLQLKNFSNEEINRAFAAVIDSICSTSNYTLSTANKIYIEKNYPVLASFLNTVSNSYKSEADKVDFVQNADGVAKEINKWVEQKTNNNIKDLFEPGVLKADTILVLVNAIYFKGSWSQEFDEKLTKMEPFTLANGTPNTVSMMNKKGNFMFAQSPELRSKILELPYAGDRLVMYVILPDEVDGLSRLQQQLTPDTFKSLRDSMTSEEVTVKIPKFTLKYKKELNDVLTKLGMNLMFDKVLANFSKIAKPINENLYVSTVIHQSFVAVDEKGTTAAAATGIAIVRFTSLIIDEPKTFIADHSFIFAIYDTATNLVLFIGHVNNPST